MSSITIVGRVYELKKLNKALHSSKAEFLAVYGRRRVGKTYLIRNFFTDKNCIFFHTTGIKKASPLIQRSEFARELSAKFLNNAILLKAAPSWLNAFEQLTAGFELHKGKKIVLFFDEFPWMADKNGLLLQALDYYWNRFWVNMPNIKLIICGSPASWIIKKIINNRGGLHNRLTMRLLIEPFTLSETKDFLKFNKINYDNKQILDLYMCIGGIPYYLSMVEKGLSAIQNINQMCFQKNGSLLDEFKNLFSSLFSNYKMHVQLIHIIAKNREGVSRQEIEALINVKGGRLTTWLEELEQTGFIISFIPWGKTKKGIYFKIIDEYTLFYLNWIHPSSNSRISQQLNSKYWEAVSTSSAWIAWSGYAFESICFKHLEKIRKALKISDGASLGSWRHVALKNNNDMSGAQIDLIFDRNDGIVHLCEIKYSKTLFKITKEYAKNLQNKLEVYKKVTQTNKQFFISMITTFGLSPSMYSDELIDSEATLNDLF